MAGIQEIQDVIKGISDVTIGHWLDRIRDAEVVSKNGDDDRWDLGPYDVYVRNLAFSLSVSDVRKALLNESRVNEILEEVNCEKACSFSIADEVVMAAIRIACCDPGDLPNGADVALSFAV